MTGVRSSRPASASELTGVREHALVGLTESPYHHQLFRGADTVPVFVIVIVVVLVLVVVADHQAGVSRPGPWRPWPILSLIGETPMNGERIFIAVSELRSAFASPKIVSDVVDARR